MCASTQFDPEGHRDLPDLQAEAAHILMKTARHRESGGGQFLLWLAYFLLAKQPVGVMPIP